MSPSQPSRSPIRLASLAALAAAAFASVPGLAEAGSPRSRRAAPPAPTAAGAKADDAIRAALDRTPAGGVAVLPFGSFRAAILVDRPLTIVANPRGTTIDATGLGRAAIEVAPGVTGVTITGVRIAGSDAEGVLAGAGVNGLTLRSLVVERCKGDGVRALGSSTLRIELLTLDRNGGDGLDLFGRDIDCRRTTVRESGGAAIRLGGEDALVSDATFVGGSEGVVFGGPRGRLFRATFRDTALVVRFAAGADTCEISRCGARGAKTFARTDDGSTDSRIVANRVAGATSDAIVLRGTRQTVESNTIGAVRGTGLVGDGVSLRVLENQFASCDGGGVRLVGMGHTVEGNSIGACGGDAVSVTGDANVVTRNRSRGARGAGVVADGGLNQILANHVDGAAREGIRLEGDANTVQDNRLLQSGLEGIAVVGGRDNRLLDNTVIACGGRGVADAGVGTTFDRNRVN